MTDIYTRFYNFVISDSDDINQAREIINLLPNLNQGTFETKRYVPILLTLDYQKYNTLKTLLEKGADPNIKSIVSGEEITPINYLMEKIITLGLFDIYEKNKKKIIKFFNLLLDYNADVNTVLINNRSQSKINLLFSLTFLGDDELLKKIIPLVSTESINFIYNNQTPLSTIIKIVKHTSQSTLLLKEVIDVYFNRNDLSNHNIILSLQNTIYNQNIELFKYILNKLSPTIFNKIYNNLVVYLLDRIHNDNEPIKTNLIANFNVKFFDIIFDTLLSLNMLTQDIISKFIKLINFFISKNNTNSNIIFNYFIEYLNSLSEKIKPKIKKSKKSKSPPLTESIFKPYIETETSDTFSPDAEATFSPDAETTFSPDAEATEDTTFSPDAEATFSHDSDSPMSSGKLKLSRQSTTGLLEYDIYLEKKIIYFFIQIFKMNIDEIKQRLPDWTVMFSSSGMYIRRYLEFTNEIKKGKRKIKQINYITINFSFHYTKILDNNYSINRIHFKNYKSLYPDGRDKKETYIKIEIDNSTPKIKFVPYPPDVNLNEYEKQLIDVLEAIIVYNNINSSNYIENAVEFYTPKRFRQIRK
jgi:hypothetical protein